VPPSVENDESGVPPAADMTWCRGRWEVGTWW
jgi:hypothetical protein